jgi:hypothetical protein
MGGVAFVVGRMTDGPTYDLDSRVFYNIYNYLLVQYLYYRLVLGFACATVQYFSTLIIVYSEYYR